MKYFLIFWGFSIIMVLFLAIFYMVGGNPISSGLLYEMVMVQLLMFIAVLVLKGRFKKIK